MKLRGATVVAVAALGLASTACQARRAVVVVSEPPGAEVRIDETAVGRTPLTVPFEYGGTRSLTLRRPGRATQFRMVDLSGPWYGYFPFDLVSDLLLGWAWEDVHRVEVTLPREDERVSEADVQALLARAESLRRAGPDGPRNRGDAEGSEDER